MSVNEFERWMEHKEDWYSDQAHEKNMLDEDYAIEYTKDNSIDLYEAVELLKKYQDEMSESINRYYSIKEVLSDVKDLL